MKKLIAALAVLAVAAVAQAELLASWNFTGSNSSDWGDGPFAAQEQSVNLSSASLSKVGLTTTAANNSMRSSGWDSEGDTASLTSSAYYKVDLQAKPNFEMTVTSITQLNSGSGGSRGGNAIWAASADNGALAQFGNAWTTANTSSQTTTGEITGSKIELRLIANMTGTSATWGFNGGSTANPSLQINGSTTEATSVPEPATMSLLGLGALAMVLRRKLRK